MTSWASLRVRASSNPAWAVGDWVARAQEIGGRRWYWHRPLAPILQPLVVVAGDAASYSGLAPFEGVELEAVPFRPES